VVLEAAYHARAKSEILRHRARRLGLKSISLRYRVGRLSRWYCGEVFAMASPADEPPTDAPMRAVEEPRTDALDGQHAFGPLGDGSRSDGRFGSAVPSDPLATALADLVEAIHKSGTEGRLLSDRLSNLREALAKGASVTEALAGEPDPGTVQLLSQLLTRLMEASGNARRELARNMRAEGTSIPAIARVFGVTHQRVSNILSAAKPAAAEALRLRTGEDSR
jgi:hypothetical protein